MWRVAAAALLLVGGSLPPLGPAPGPDQRVTTRRPSVVWIDGGWFLRGSDEEDIRYAIELCASEGLPACPQDLFVEEAPRERIWVSAYGIDRTEVTNEAWRRCVAANVCAPSRLSATDQRLTHDTQPVAGVSWREAERYCEWVGGRLPTEAEWERAGRGHDARRFPWGDYYNPRLANHGKPDTHRLNLPIMGRFDDVDGYRFSAPVGSYPDSASPYGLQDVAGNVWEWTGDLHDPEAYIDAIRVDPRGGREGGRRVIRGGSWRFPAYGMRVTNRGSWPEGAARPDLGLRCAYDPEAR